jgi:hypothetical protein
MKVTVAENMNLRHDTSGIVSSMRKFFKLISTVVNIVAVVRCENVHCTYSSAWSKNWL